MTLYLILKIILFYILEMAASYFNELRVNIKDGNFFVINIFNFIIVLQMITP